MALSVLSLVYTVLWRYPRFTLVPFQGRIQDFSLGKGSGWYLGVAESMGLVPKMLQFENWNSIVNLFTRNTGNVTK